MITVEYLLPFNIEDGICEDIESFKSLLCSNANFKIRNGEIEYKGLKYKFKCKCTLVTVEDKNCSVFHVILKTSSLTEKFLEMLKSFRKTVGVLLKDNIQIIWDGVSFEWSKELYPQIYQVENSFRKLISKFMLINLGIGWYDSAVPEDVKESIKKGNSKPSLNILYEFDFIQLSNLIFIPYTTKDLNKLPEILSDVVKNGMNENKKNEISGYIPKNNWDRYFSDLVSLESDQLRKKWKNLYEIRCKIAHNKPMQFEDFKNAQKLCTELENVIEEAIDNIDNVKVPEEDQKIRDILKSTLESTFFNKDLDSIDFNDYKSSNSLMSDLYFSFINDKLIDRFNKYYEEYIENKEDNNDIDNNEKDKD